MPTLAIPTVHLNGTSREALLEGLCEAVHALHEAGSAMAKASPNMRDYYINGADAFIVAQDQHTARMDKIREVITELQTIAEAL